VQLKSNQLTAQLARGLAPIYLVAGDEPLLIEEALDAIRAAARKAGYSEREVLETERGFEWQQLLDSCASMSLFATRRIIEVRLRGSPGVDGGKVLRELAQKPPPDVLLLVIAGALESEARRSAWFTALESAGASLYIWPVKPEELPGWLSSRLRQAGMQADAEVVAYLAERTEGNLLAAAQDIEKLRLLFPQGQLRLAEVRKLIADSARFGAFDFNEKVMEGDPEGVVRALGRLREEGEELIGILSALIYDLRRWALAAFAMERGRDASAACVDAKIFGPQQARFLKGLRRARSPQVERWLRRCAEIDATYKSGRGEQAWEDLLKLALAASGSALSH
jgi:DNA polymerase-3 subunit delta